MKTYWFVTGVILAGCSSINNGALPLRLTETLPLPGVKGRIDHMAADVQGRRLFVAALGNNSVEIVDAMKGKYLGRIAGLDEPQGILFLPEYNRIVIANGGDGSCRIYDGKTLALRNTLNFHKDADNLRYDAKARRVYVGYGDGALGVIDPDQGKTVATIPLGGHPEAFALETGGRRIFVNIPMAHQVAVVDRPTNKVIARWPITDAKSNFPMALDEARHRLFIGCRTPARMLVLDTDTGKTVGRVDIPGDCDDLFFDAAAKRIYLSCGSGAIAVIDEKSADDYRITGKVSTALGARTSLWVPQWKVLYLAVPNLLLHKPQIQAYRFQ